MPTNNSINSQDPIQVAKGGTGQSTLTTANGILAAGTTATGAIQNIGTGSAGQVLTSNGTSLPSFQAAPSGGAMTLLHTITFNNTASSYDITPYVTGYEIYKFFVQKLPANGASNSFAAPPWLGFEFSVDGGVTFISTGYTGRIWTDRVSSSGGYDVTNFCPFAMYHGFPGPQVQSEGMISGYGSAIGVNVQATQGGVWNQTNPIFAPPSFIDAFVAVHSSALLTGSLNGIRITSNNSTNIVGGKFSLYGIAT